MAERAIQLWPVMVEYIKFVMSLAPTKRPRDNKLFEIYRSKYTELMMIYRFSFFKEVARLLNEFLREF